MGLYGAGWGTLLTKILSMLIAVYCVFRERPLKIRSAIRKAIDGVSIAHVAQLLRTGLPMGLHHLLEVLAYTVLVLMMGWLSPQAQAAHAVVCNVSFCYLSVSWGLCNAAAVMWEGLPVCLSTNGPKERQAPLH